MLPVALQDDWPADFTVGVLLRMDIDIHFPGFYQAKQHGQRPPAQGPAEVIARDGPF